MAAQVQLVDHPGLQQRDGVGGDRIAEARMELFGHRRAADHAAPFQHGDLQAGPGQVGRAHQAVVAAADQQRIAGGMDRHFS